MGEIDGRVAVNEMEVMTSGDLAPGVCHGTKGNGGPKTLESMMRRWSVKGTYDVKGIQRSVGEA